VAAETGQERMDDDKPNAHRIVSVSPDMLPLHCPQSGTTLWNSHPRVFIAVEETGQARCAYCGTEFVIAKPAEFDPSVSMIDAVAGLDGTVDPEAADIFGG
jgi:uncharacterized Zn-finger protein